MVRASRAFSVGPVHNGHHVVLTSRQRLQRHGVGSCRIGTVERDIAAPKVVNGIDTDSKQSVISVGFFFSSGCLSRSTAVPHQFVRTPYTAVPRKGYGKLRLVLVAGSRCIVSPAAAAATSHPYCLSMIKAFTWSGRLSVTRSLTEP
jgi:hypothetical protein